MKQTRVLLRTAARVTLLAAVILSASLGAAPTVAQSQSGAGGKLDPEEVALRLGIPRPEGTSPTEYSLQVAGLVEEHGLPEPANPAPDLNAPLTGLPEILSDRAAFSAAVLTTIGGRNTQFDEVALLADLDGREDLTADRAREVDDFSTYTNTVLSDWTLTRVAFSEHTISNGFTETVFYFGDSVGNVFVAVDGNDSESTGVKLADSYTVLNLPTLLNAFGTLLSDDQIVITGLGINPVADLTSYANVNGAFAPFAELTGEILYVSFWDTGSGLRLAANNTVVRSGLLAFPIADTPSITFTPPAIQSPFGFPVTVGGAFGVIFSVFDNLAGVAVDDDGSVYYQQVDLIRSTGANIVKATSVDVPLAPGNQDRSLATNGILTITTLNPASGNYGTTSGPVNQINRFTNYSGTSTTFGNIAALAAGPGNTLYAAVARSYSATDDPATQSTEGLFTNPAALGATPSMIISFADTIGAFDVCSSITSTTTGTLPVADGRADVGLAGLTPTPGVNNFRVFVTGNGPDIRSSVVGATPANTLQLDLQVDYTIYSGLAVDEEHKAYVISGGTPGGVGMNPSPARGEILAFPDHVPADRRADFEDLRGNGLPNPPLNGGNVGDGDSDRFDHVFWLAPMDQVTLTPTGIAGLSRGFLLYLNRTRTEAGAFPTLPNGTAQGDDSTNGPVFFEQFDLSHQVAGGDDQNPPFTGDDADGAGSPVAPGPLQGGFEFVIGASDVVSTSVWNAFFLNSNGNVTFGIGDTDNRPATTDFLTGPPRIAPAWFDPNPASRSQTFTNTFPVQALGFPGVNHFKVRWINVPQYGKEDCASNHTFSISLFDDGLAQDENAPGLTEGPTDLRFTTDPDTGQLVGNPPRPNGRGQFCFDYGRMDALGTPVLPPVVTGYSVGGQPPSPPGLSETDLGEAARAADLNPYTPGLIGNGTQAIIFEQFDAGLSASGGGPATPDLDLRFEGNDPLSSTPVNQADLNRDRLCFFGVTPGATLTFGSRAASATGVASSPNPSALGQSVTFTATVAVTGPSLPSGTVTFKDGTSVLGTGTVHHIITGTATATFTTSSLSVGTHSITAEYGGDSNFNTSVSSALAQVVMNLNLYLPLLQR